MVRASQDQQQDEDYNPFEGDAHTQGGVRQRMVEWQVFVRCRISLPVWR